MQTETIRVVLILGEAGADIMDEPYLPLLEVFSEYGINDIMVFSSKLDESGYTELADSLTAEGKKLCIAVGYPFTDTEAAGIIASAVDDGLRLLVLDPGMTNKKLADLLDISNIKHKLRIESLDFTDWTDEKSRLLTAILKDEFGRFA